MKKEPEKRKSYSVLESKSLALGRASLQMTEDLGKTVHRQTILNALIDTLSDKDVYKKVLNRVKKAL